MNMKRTFVASAVAAAVVASTWGIAIAQQPEAATELTSVQVIEKLASLGYTAIDEVEKDDGVWEVEATAPNGTRVELELDRKDGRILKEERDDDDDGRQR